MKKRSGWYPFRLFSLGFTLGFRRNQNKVDIFYMTLPMPYEGRIPVSGNGLFSSVPFSSTTYAASRRLWQSFDCSVVEPSELCLFYIGNIFAKIAEPLS